MHERENKNERNEQNVARRAKKPPSEKREHNAASSVYDTIPSTWTVVGRQRSNGGTGTIAARCAAALWMTETRRDRLSETKKKLFLLSYIRTKGKKKRFFGGLAEG